MTNNEIMFLLALLSPIIIIQLAMAIYSLVDLAKRKQLRGPRWVWAVALILTSLAIPTGIIVSAVYLGWGRHAENKNDLTHDSN